MSVFVCVCAKTVTGHSSTNRFSAKLLSPALSSSIPLFRPLVCWKKRLLITFPSQIRLQNAAYFSGRQRCNRQTLKPDIEQMTAKVKQHYWFVSVLGRSVFPGDPSGPVCLSIRAGAIRPSESGSIPSCHGDKIKAFRQPKRSLPCALAHNVPLLKHPVAMEMQLQPFK